MKGTRLGVASHDHHERAILVYTEYMTAVRGGMMRYICMIRNGTRQGCSVHSVRTACQVFATRHVGDGTCLALRS